MTSMENNFQKKTGILGLFSVIIFMVALVFFGNLNPTFNFWEDFVSKLGATGEPHAMWWNFIGFGIVGMMLFGFGILYGKVIKDEFAGVLLSLFGIGFAFTAFPIDMEQSNTSISKAHIVAICLALAFWLFGLARISYNVLIHKKIRDRANLTAILIVTSMIGFTFELWSMPITHRLVFLVVFGWMVITSVELLNMKIKG